MNARESSLDNDLFFACGLIEYIARTTHNMRSTVVDALGAQRVAHIIEYADVLHSENIDAVGSRYAAEAGLEQGNFDNVSCARYGSPSHWDMGKVYKRLAVGIMDARSCDPTSAVLEAFHSPIAPLIDDYNGSFFYEAPTNILTAHLTGEVE